MSLGFPNGVLPYHTPLSSIFSTTNCRKWCLVDRLPLGLTKKLGFVLGLFDVGFPMGLGYSWFVDCQFVLLGVCFFRPPIGSVLLRCLSHYCRSLLIPLMGVPGVRGRLRGWGLLAYCCSRCRILSWLLLVCCCWRSVGCPVWWLLLDAVLVAWPEWVRLQC